MTREQSEALDPATPAPRLLALCQDNLELVLQNPALPLLLLEAPDFFARLSFASRVRLAGSPRCPLAFAAPFRRTSAHDAEILAALVMNPALPVALRRQLFLAEFPRDADASSHDHPDVAAELLAPDDHWLLARARRVDSELTEAEFAQLATLGLRGAVAAMAHPRCPAALLERFFDASVYSANTAVPAHPNLDLARLADFLESPDPHVRIGASRNPQLSPAQFERASQRDDTCEAMALNVALPTAWFDRLLHDPRVGVRENLARNRSLPEPLMAELAVDPARSVRRTLLRHPELPDDLRAKIRI